MKKTCALLVGISVIAASALAESPAPVTSKNIVGLNKITCPKGKYVLVSTAFKSMDGAALKSKDVFGAQLPMGTTIFVWDPSGNVYIKDSYIEDDEGNPMWGENITYKGGMGFWIGVANAGAATNEIFLTGEVPMQQADTNSVYTGYNLLGYPFTAGVAWTNTALAKTARLGDTVFLWDLPSNSYIKSSYIEDEEGNPMWSNPDLVITPSVGFWYQTGKSPFGNVEQRPYNP